MLFIAMIVLSIIIVNVLYKLLGTITGSSFMIYSIKSKLTAYFVVFILLCLLIDM